MPEIKSTFSKEQLTQYSKDNQLDVLNINQISAKFMELENRIENAQDRIDQMQKVIDEALIKNNEPLMEIYDKAIEYLKKIKELESK